jgi:hypothetical protein
MGERTGRSRDWIVAIAGWVPLRAARAANSLEHGRYLVNDVACCND